MMCSSAREPATAPKPAREGTAGHLDWPIGDRAVRWGPGDTLPASRSPQYSGTIDVTVRLTP